MILEGGDIRSLAEVVACILNAQDIDIVGEGDGLNVEGWSCGMDGEVLESEVPGGGKKDEVAVVPGFIRTIEIS